MLKLELPYDIAITIPTRGRTVALGTSIMSMINRATKPERIQVIVAFDQDDMSSVDYFNENIKPWLLERGIAHTVMITPRYGYYKLNHYVNLMARVAEAEWIIFWNDDAIMDTDGWDRTIASYNGQFKVLSFRAHNDHPYSIFPIMPYMWVRILGHVARHQQSDHEVSHMAYLLDVFERIDVHVTHDRADLTGNNNDETYANRPYATNDPNHIDSFYHTTYTSARHQDLDRLTEYMRYIGMDTSWWENTKAGKNKDPFKKLADNDPNFQTVAGQQRLKMLLAAAEEKAKAEAQAAEEAKAKTSKKKEKVK